jgi:hypothetical protein
MALVNPNIAMSFKPTTELQQPNALAQYAQIQQIVGGQRQGEVADMQLEALRRDRDALSQIQAAIVAKGGPPDLAAAADAMIKSGKPEFLTQGMAIRQKLADQAAFANYQKEFSPAASTSMPTGAPAPTIAPEAGSFAADVASRRAVMPANALAAPTAAPVNALAPAPTAAPATAPVSAAAGQPDIASLEARYRRVANLETPGAKAEAALLLKQIDRAATATPADIKTMQSLGYPLTQAGFKQFRDAFRTDRLLSPEEEAQKVRIATASRAPIQPVAPTITQIVDPVNPNRMITIDARRYTGGTVGSPGVLGVGGKEPGAAVRENKAEAGKTQLADDLDNLRASFTRLDEMRAIPSTARGVLSNLSSATAASGFGQTLARAGGTEEQVERDVINSARTRLVNSIKNATGMSAQQLNSNVELQTMLKSISDPGQSVQAALRIIDDIDNAYVKGAGMPKKPAGGNKPSTGVDTSNPLLK